MDLVKHNEPVFQGVEKQTRLGQPGKIVPILKIEIDSAQFPGDVEGERGLAGLPRTGEHHGCLSGQSRVHFASHEPRDHQSCILGTLCRIFNVVEFVIQS